MGKGKAPLTEYGARLRAGREKAGLTAAQLAARVGVTEGAIRQQESGQTYGASLQVGLRIAAELGVDPWYLAFGTAQAEVPQTRDQLAERIRLLEERYLLGRPRADREGRPAQNAPQADDGPRRAPYVAK